MRYPRLRLYAHSLECAEKFSRKNCAKLSAMGYRSAGLHRPIMYLVYWMRIRHGRVTEPANCDEHLRRSRYNWGVPKRTCSFGSFLLSRIRMRVRHKSAGGRVIRSEGAKAMIVRGTPHEKGGRNAGHTNIMTSNPTAGVQVPELAGVRLAIPACPTAAARPRSTGKP